MPGIYNKYTLSACLTTKQTSANIEKMKGVFTILSKIIKTKKGLKMTTSLTLIAIVFTNVLSVAAPPKAHAAPARKDLKGIRIVVDPGHGGHDAGALAPNGLQEKFVNLSVSKHLGNMLKKEGAQVRLTRTSDKFVSLPGRANIANKAKAHRFISVHQNSAPRKGAMGTETYFHHKRAAKLAKFAQNELLKYLKYPNRGAHKAAFAVIRRTNMPGILTEAAFMSNPREAKRLQSSAYRERQAFAIFNGIKRDLGLKSDPLPRNLGLKSDPPPAPSPPAPAPAPAPVQKKPINYGPPNLQVQFTDTFGVVENSKIESIVYVPYMSGNNKIISVRNVGKGPVSPSIIFKDLLGNRVKKIKPLVNAKDTFSFYPRNIVNNAFIGSIDIIEPSEKMSQGLTAALASIIVQPIIGIGAGYGK